LRAPGTKRGRRAAPATLAARLVGHVTLEAGSDGNLVARFDGHSVGLGTFSAAAAERAQHLRAGLPLASIASSTRTIDKEILLLVRRLALRGLLEYRLGRSRGDRDRREDQVVIEPQVPGYWPQAPQLGVADVLVLSRFAYLRRRGNDMVLESPRSGAVFRICDPDVAAALATLSAPQPLGRLRRQDGFPGVELLALLLDCKILFRLDAADDSALRADEGDDSLVLWDFHDLLFHARSTEGRHANPIGGVYPYAGVMPSPPAVRPRWPGKAVDLRELSPAPPVSAAATLLRDRHSTRSFDDQRPITLAELARFLDGAARVQSTWESRLDFGDGEGDGSPVVEYAVRPYPSGGGSYGLELYLAVDKCEGLARGFYHYDAGAHALVPIGVRAQELDALLAGAGFAMDAPAAPQILITIAARFGRTAWKYSSLAYALILKDAGVLTQTLYLMATDLGLGGCAIGTANIDLFARMTGIEFHVEGPVGQFALGRGVMPEPSE
jgi:SagB-type dehydrogenase family enzyme